MKKKRGKSLHIKIRNFRSIKEAQFDLNPGLNVLIGPNGSGKTNILAAFKFIRDLLQSGAALAMGWAGGAPHNYYRGSKEIEFEVSGYYDDCRYLRGDVPFYFVWTISIAQSGPDRISAVSNERFQLKAATGPNARRTVLDIEIKRPYRGKRTARSRLLDKALLGKNLFRQPHGKLVGGSKEKMFEEARSQLTELGIRYKKLSNQSFLMALGTMHPRVGELYQSLNYLEEYNIHPDAARSSTDQVPQASMKPNGEGLSAVIHALLSRDWDRLSSGRQADRFYYFRSQYFFDPGNSRYFPYYLYPDNVFYVRYRRGTKNKHPLADAMTNINGHLSAAVNSVNKVGTQIDPTNGRRYVVFHSGKHEFRPEEVSDGTIKWLCLLVSMFVPFSRTYLLEEPENFMHPWMQQRLVQIMREQATSKKLTFLATSHSATVLNSLEPDEILLVGHKDGSTTTKSLEDEKEIQNFLDSSNFGLGDLWVSGGLGAVPGGA